MKKFVMYTNYLNHHQLPFCIAMQKYTNDSFLFVTQKAIASKRIGIYKTMDEGYPFLLKTYESEENLERAYKEALEADFVMIDHSNDSYVYDRLKQNKLTLRQSERPFKTKLKYFNWLRSLRRIYLNQHIFEKHKMYLLCDGAYAANDFNKFGVYRNRTYKWGYFPEAKKYDVDFLLKNKTKNKIVWVGRLLKWKHPEYAVKVAKKLKDDGINFSMSIIGSGDREGDEKANLTDYINDNNLNDNVNLLGSMSTEEVRKHMEDASIYLFTSDCNEGWGAVLNEAMNSCCACVASHEAGATGFLIKHKENGLIYKSGDIEDLYEKTKQLLIDERLRKNISRKAYDTIFNTWNGDEAARRLLILCNCLRDGEETPFIDGPCSKAYPIKDSKMYDYLVKNEDS